MLHTAFATTAATRPCKRKKAAGFLLPPSVSRYHRSGKPKSRRCSFQSSGMFFMICAMDNPSGSAPLTITSTMSGAKLFKPSTRVTYGGFKPSEALGTHCHGNAVPDAFCRFRAALCRCSGSDGSVVASPAVSVGVYRRESGYLVVAWVK